MDTSYDRLTPAQLRELLTSCGLPTTGNGSQMRKRLQQFQAGRTVVWEDPPLGSGVVDPAIADRPLPDTPIQVVPDPPADLEGHNAQTNTYWVLHPLPDGQTIDDGMHQQLLAQTVRSAQGAGYQVRGGLYAGRRTNYVQRGTDLFICYEVSVKRT